MLETITGGAIANPIGRYAQYRATLTSGDLLESPVVDEVRLTFNRLDIAPPNVVSVSPPDGAGGILPGTAVMATFDEALDPATVSTASFTVTPAGGIPVAAAASDDSTSFTVIMAPAAPLDYSTAHEVRLTAAVTDTDGNHLAGDHVWAFTTIDPDLTPPAVVATEPLDPATITTAGGQLRLQGQLNDTFDAPALSSVWHATNPEGYTPVIAGGILDVQERDPDYEGRSAIESYQTWGPGAVLEARAMFVPGSEFIDVGFDANTDSNIQYAWFSSAGTGNDPGNEKITARVREFGRETVAIETGATYNEWHDFKIIWTPGQVEFFVDGELVATHTDVLITYPMHAAFYKTQCSETPFYIDWIRVTPYVETQGAYASPVIDGGLAVTSGALVGEQSAPTFLRNAGPGNCC